MNTIERIEARSELHNLRSSYHVTADEWSAIKAVIEALQECRRDGHDWTKVWAALSKLEK